MNEEIDYIFSIGSKEPISYCVSWKMDTKLYDEILDFIGFRDKMYSQEYKSRFGDLIINRVSAVYISDENKADREDIKYNLDNFSLLNPDFRNFNKQLPTYLMYIDRLKTLYDIQLCVSREKFNEIASRINNEYPIEEFIELVPIAGILKIIFSECKDFLVKPS